MSSLRIKQYLRFSKFLKNYYLIKTWDDGYDFTGAEALMLSLKYNRRNAFYNIEEE